MRHRTLRLLSLGVIIGLPTASTLFDVANLKAPARTHGSLIEPGATGDDGAMAAGYLARRDPRLDQLLPGAGGGRLFVAGMDVAGKALLHLNAILLSPIQLTEEIELHELAHLVKHNLPREAKAVLATVVAPAPTTYAATNDTEHFAEMAAEAWMVLVVPEGFCANGDAVSRLTRAEAMVPGTAGFVAYFLTLPAFAHDTAAASLQPALAQYLPAEQRAVWHALWEALDARRGPDGLPQPWPALSALEVHRGYLRMSESRVVQGLLRALYFPSEVLVRVVAG